MSPTSQTNTLLGLLHMKMEKAPSSKITIRIFHAGFEDLTQVLMKNSCLLGSCAMMTT
jgi:hypothetical protein